MFVLAFEHGLVVGILSHQVSLEVEEPPSILSDGVGELQLQRDSLQLDVLGDRAPVLVAFTVTTSVASVAGCCPSVASGNATRRSMIREVL